MSRLPRVIAIEVPRALRRAGWAERRQTGSHVILSHPTQPGRVGVPFHRGRSLPTGTLDSILGQAGLTADEGPALTKRDYTIILTPEPDGSAYNVTVPALPGCFTRGETIEGTYRDAQTGWDGHHGWDLARQAARLPDPDAVARLVGLWALATLIQTWLGAQVVAPTAPAHVQQVAAQWTTTGRLSLWALGRFALSEPSGWLRPWVLTTLADGATRLAAPPPQTPRQIAPPPTPPSAPTVFSTVQGPSSALTPRWRRC